MTRSVLIILTAAVVTALLRALPFALFAHRQLPRIITYLGQALPPAIMAVLVVYCLRTVDLAGSAHGAPELLAVAVTALLHLWRGKTLFSIAGGTVAYMVLLRLL